MMDNLITLAAYTVLGIFATLIGGLVVGIMGWGSYLLFKIVMDIVSLFIPKNYRKGGKFHQK